MSEVQRIPVSLPEGWSGEIFVEVVSAIERDGDYVNGVGRRKVAHPALRVTTYTDRALEQGVGIKYRGKVYHADYVYMLEPTGTPDRWLVDHRDYMARGLLTEARNPLDWKSPVRSRLSDAVAFARESFVSEHPEWANESLSMRLESMIRRASESAESLRREAAEHDARADKLVAELAALREA